MLLLLSAVTIRGIFAGNFQGPWGVLGPLAIMSLMYLLGEGAVNVGKQGIEIKRKINGNKGEANGE